MGLEQSGPIHLGSKLATMAYARAAADDDDDAAAERARATGELRPIRDERRLSDTETIMWWAERDPMLRSSFLSITLLDRAPDVARFKRRMAAAATQIRRLHERVVSPPGGIGRPEWVEDSHFDLDYHVRRAMVPTPGDERQLLDLAAQCYQDPFDVARPLWQFTIVEGLEGGRAALLAKMHHTISDGVGAVRLSALFVDVEPDPPEVVSPQSPDLDQDLQRRSRVGGAVAELTRVPFDLGRRGWSTLAGSVAHPLSVPRYAVDGISAARSAVRQMTAAPSLSPLWSGQRSLGRRFEIFSCDLTEAKAAAHALGGTLNDLYVAAVVGGAGDYHRTQGAPVDELRASIPINTRTDRSAGGNSFLPARVVLPAGIEDPAERFAAVHRRLAVLKSDRSAGVAEALVGLLAWLPPDVVVRLVRSQVDTIDFAASNVRGAPFDLYIAGALILANHPFGPTGGTAFNATLLSYKTNMDIGLNIDTDAVVEPELLKACLIDSFTALVAAGSR
jgi:diacylglycerol O-acyltransferase / wax synthase